MTQAASTTALPSAGSAIVTLDRVQRTANDKLLVSFSAGQRAWSIELVGRHLNSFSGFRAHVADLLGLWVDHESQGGFRARDRDEAWEAAVSDAFIAGAK